LSISLFCFANKVHVAETLPKLGYSTDEDLKDGSLFHRLLCFPCLNIGGLQRLSISLFCYKFANKVHVAETLSKLGYSANEDLKDGSLFHRLLCFPCLIL